MIFSYPNWTLLAFGNQTLLSRGIYQVDTVSSLSMEEKKGEGERKFCYHISIDISRGMVVRGGVQTFMQMVPLVK